MIEVKRFDYPARDVKRRDGKIVKTIPARYTVRYHYQGKEIAFYESQHDVLYLRSELTLHDWSQTLYKRALAGKYKEVFGYLFDMLGVDETTRLSEYTNL